ncbi:kinesin-like protein KIF11 isoform X2 [Tribolium castaneum]|nr:PREDICTED: kinesin-like protein KIF11 isoform X2 [Tribolium castaneum]|eukprot:XP_008193511.1 PREDICTED: kinesin-like protein KIF11 isoform X2 [Tribolium castaneum]
MIPRAAVDILDKLSQLGVECVVTASFVELYNEEIRDLVVNDNSGLSVHDDPNYKGVTRVKGVTEIRVKNCTELFEMLMVGANNRSEPSLHCHTIFTIGVTIFESFKGEKIVKTGRIHLIDLAGSNFLASCGALVINKALQTFKTVIQALASESKHVPMRDSKLTRVLQDCLNGKGNTSIIATISPCSDAFEDTVTTLDYVQMARGVSTNPVPNVINIRRDDEVKNLEDEVSSLRRDLGTAGSFRAEIENYAKLMELKVNHEKAVALTAEITKLEGVCEHQKYYPDTGELAQETTQKCEPQAEAKNAEIATEMVHVSFEALSGVEFAVELFQNDERSNLSDIATNNEKVREVTFMNLGRLRTILSNVCAFADSLKCTLDSLLSASEFTETSARANLTTMHIENHSILADNYHRVKATLCKLQGYIESTKTSLAEATFQYEDDVGMQYSLLSDMYERFYTLLTNLHATMQKRYLRIQHLMSLSNQRLLLLDKITKNFLNTQEDLTLELETMCYIRGYAGQLTELLQEKAPGIDNKLITLFTKFNQETAHLHLISLQRRFEAAKEEIQQSQTVCLEEVAQNHSRHQDYFRSFFDAIRRGVATHNEGVVATRDGLSFEAYMMVSHQYNMTVDRTSQISNSLDDMFSNAKDLTSEMEDISTETVAKLKQLSEKVTVNSPKEKKEVKKTLLQEKQDNSNEPPNENQ